VKPIVELQAIVPRVTFVGKLGKGLGTLSDFLMEVPRGILNRFVQAVAELSAA
jgi:hypothetical protein